MRYQYAVGLVVVLGVAASCSGATFEGGEGGTGGQQSGTGGKGLGIGGGATGGAAAASGGKPGSTSGGQAATGGAFGLGGAASGGAQGLGGAGTGGGSSGGSRTTGGTGSAGHAECKTVADCMLADDCCRCASVPSGELTPSCLLACIQSACSAQQISTGDIACVTGRCVLSRSCDERAVSCDAPTPQCDSGAVPEVTGTCYSGRCLAVTECSDVTSCDICTQRGLRCVTQGGIPRNTFHCVETPAACQNISSCACMGVCQDPFQCADTNSETLMCVCPIC